MVENDFLYHYTSLESLALILKNRTIRFNSLSNVDDLQEKASKDVKNMGKYCFVSSWTSEKVESIPMWKMYGNPKAGVRIGLPANPFKIYRISVEELREMTKGRIEDPDGTIFEGFFDEHDQYNGNYTILQRSKSNILHEVEYTEDISLLFPTIFKQNGDTILGYFNNYGIYKNTYWAFQKEWRYLFMVFPYSPHVHARKKFVEAQKEVRQTIEEMRNGTGQVPFDDYFLSIRDDCFERMEVIASPQMTSGNRILLETIIAEYNPKATLKDSDLYGKI